jgi:hypothetical protein
MIKMVERGARVARALAIVALLGACSGDAPGTVTGPGPSTGPGSGTGPGGGDPGAVGSYTLKSVNGENMPFLFDDVVLGPSRIQSYVMGGKLVLNADGSYTASVDGRWIMDGKVINRTSSGSGRWQLVGEGTLRLNPSTGGSVTMERTWYTLTETRQVPAGSGTNVELIYVWVID